MSQLGLGVMLRSLCGNEENVNAFTSSLNKTITAIDTDDENLWLTFDDGTRLRFYDDGQSCCEKRWMEPQANYDPLLGSKLLGGEMKQLDELPDEYGNHELCELSITTDKGAICSKFHNEHNGYYGGFYITTSLVKT